MHLVRCTARELYQTICPQDNCVKDCRMWSAENFAWTAAAWDNIRDSATESLGNQHCHIQLQFIHKYYSPQSNIPAILVTHQQGERLLQQKGKSSSRPKACVCHMCSAVDVTPAYMHADLNPQSLSSFSASRIFYGNGQLALIDGHITLVL